MKLENMNTRTSFCKKAYNFRKRKRIQFLPKLKSIQLLKIILVDIYNVL